MSREQPKLDPAFRRQTPAPRLRDLVRSAEQPEPPRHPWLRWTLSVLIAMVVGAGVMSSWFIVAPWFNLPH